MQLSKADLFPHVVKDKAAAGKIFGYLASLDGPPEEISYQRLNNAVDRAARFIDKNIPQDEKVFAWLGKMDFRYTVWMVAASKTGKIAAFPSLKNAPEANVGLLSKMGAKTVLYCPDSKEQLDPHLKAASNTTTLVPAFTWVDAMDETPVDPYPFDLDYESHKNRHIVAIHTSGTSGNPTPLYLSTEYFKARVVFDEQPTPTSTGLRALFPSWFQDSSEDFTMFSIFPLNHFGGLYFTTMAMAVNMRLCMPSADVPLIPDNIAQLMSPGFDFFCAVPTLLREMVKHAECVERLKKLRFIVSSGAPLEPAVGAAVAAINPHFQTGYATSEVGAPPLVRTDDFRDTNPNYWNTVQFLPSDSRFEEVLPGTFELVIPRTPLTERYYDCFTLFPELDEWRTRDLFVPVDGHPDGWIYTGRHDDLIALANGLKYDPVPMQNEVATHPDVRDVLIAGANRLAPCMIIDMIPGKIPETPTDLEAALERLWPTIEAANKHVAKFGKVPREMILFTTLEKGFLRTPKMSIKRKLTIATFQNEIDALYEKNEAGLLTSDLPPISEISPAGMADCLLHLYSETIGVSDLKESDDLFAKGIDSFSMALVQTRLKAALRPSLALNGIPESQLERVDKRLLYGNPTVASVARAISALMSKENGNVTNGTGSHEGYSIVQEVEGLLAEFQARVILPHRDLPQKQSGKPWKVLLTGTTGSIGTYLLAALLARSTSEVAHVFCINRGAQASTRQDTALRSRGLPEISDPSRVTFLTAAYGSPRLGLGEDKWHQLCEETTLIIHNAWPVNFMLPVSAFRAQLETLSDLIALSHAAQDAPPLLFISSVGVVGGNPWDDGSIREEVHHRPEATLPQGYAQSKYIGERLIESYTQSSGCPAAILRVGQVSGPVNSAKGAWSRQEWFPSLVFSSKHIGALPEQSGSLAYVDWVPVDELVKVISEIAGNIMLGDARMVYNVMNSNPISYKTLLPALAKELGVDVVPAAKWINLLRESSDKTGGIVSEVNPGVKLLDFYEEEFLTTGSSMPKVTVGNLLASSATARSLPAVNDSWMHLWLQQWQLS